MVSLSSEPFFLKGLPIEIWLLILNPLQEFNDLIALHEALSKYPALQSLLSNRAIELLYPLVTGPYNSVQLKFKRTWASPEEILPSSPRVWQYNSYRFWRPAVMWTGIPASFSSNFLTEASFVADGNENVALTLSSRITRNNEVLSASGIDAAEFDFACVRLQSRVLSRWAHCRRSIDVLYSRRQNDGPTTVLDVTSDPRHILRTLSQDLQFDRAIWTDKNGIRFTMPSEWFEFTGTKLHVSVTLEKRTDHGPPDPDERWDNCEHYIKTWSASFVGIQLPTAPDILRLVPPEIIEANASGLHRQE